MNKNENVEMKLIRILNEIDNIKKELDKKEDSILTEVKKVDQDLETITDLLDHVPKQTLSELTNIKKNKPEIYYKLKAIISDKVKASLVDIIDANILKAIYENKRIGSRDLLKKVETEKINQPFLNRPFN